MTGGLENLFYNGRKTSSDSLSSLSPDTPDNTPVVETFPRQDFKCISLQYSSDQDGGLGVESPGRFGKGTKVVDPHDLGAFGAKYNISNR